MSFGNTVIFGDSYSTFEGYIPEGYACHYFLVPKNEVDVTKVEETWWYKLMKETGSTLLQNNSWSGSTIGYTAYGGRDCSGDSSFIYRFEKLLKDGFFEENKIDTIFVFGGTNDSWCGAPLGEESYGEVVFNERFSVLPAICHFFKRIAEELPEVRKICIVNTGLKDEISSCLKNAVDKYGFEKVVLSDIDKMAGHPTIKGMEQIKEQVKAVSFSSSASPR